MSSFEPTRCAGQLHYRDAHADVDRFFILFPPSGEPISCCSWECLIEVLCEPAQHDEMVVSAQLPPARERRRRRRHLAVVR